MLSNSPLPQNHSFVTSSVLSPAYTLFCNYFDNVKFMSPAIEYSDE